MSENCSKNKHESPLLVAFSVVVVLKCEFRFHLKWDLFIPCRNSNGQYNGDLWFIFI